MDLTTVKIIVTIVGFTVSGGLLIAFLTLYYLQPSALWNLLNWVARLLSGAKVKYIEHEGYRFSYLCRGEPGIQPSMLMLHGFAVNKDSWDFTIKYFPKDLHVVCLDMPGHEGTTRLMSESYTGEDQAKRIHEFVKCSGLIQKPFHLVGISMGGMVAGVYAALYPSEVCCLSLLCPAGLKYPVDNELAKQLKKLENSHSDINPLIPLTVKQAENYFKILSYHQVRLTKQMLKGFIDYRSPNTSFYKKCIADFLSEESRYSLHEHMSKIQARTQIIWGRNDQVLDVSGSQILAHGISNSQVHILDECGHVIPAERPRKCAKLILHFHTSVCNSSNKKLS